MMCFRTVPVLKVLGPIRDFVLSAGTDVKWLDKKLHSVQTFGDQTDFRVSMSNIDPRGRIIRQTVLLRYLCARFYRLFLRMVKTI